MTAFDAEDIARRRAICEAATPEPWTFYRAEESRSNLPHVVSEASDSDPWICYGNEGAGRDLYPEDGDFISHVRTGYPEALSAVEERDRVIAEKDAEIERLRVQLAGCSVAALGNTEGARRERVAKDCYGWSQLYQDVCDAVDREIALRAEVERLRGMLEPIRSLCARIQRCELWAMEEVAGMLREIDAALGPKGGE